MPRNTSPIRIGRRVLGLGLNALLLLPVLACGGRDRAGHLSIGHDADYEPTWRLTPKKHSTIINRSL